MRSYLKVRAGRVDEVAGAVVKEQPLTIYVDGERFLTLLCTPVQVEALVIGYLWMEKVIAGLDEVAQLDVSTVDGRADVILTQPVLCPPSAFSPPGVAGGITFRIDHRLFPRLTSSLRVRPEQVAARMKDLFEAAVHYKQSRGIHGAALSDGDRLLVVAEDVGRHNAVDKVKGEALVRADRRRRTASFSPPAGSPPRCSSRRRAWASPSWHRAPRRPRWRSRSPSSSTSRSVATCERRA